MTTAPPVWTVILPENAAAFFDPWVVVTALAAIVFVTDAFWATVLRAGSTFTTIVRVHGLLAGIVAPVTLNAVSPPTRAPPPVCVMAAPAHVPPVVPLAIMSAVGRLSWKEAFVKAPMLGLVRGMVSVLKPVVGSMWRTFGLKLLAPVRLSTGATVSVALAASGFDPWLDVVTRPIGMVFT